jgi:hypothetical protein
MRTEVNVIYITITKRKANNLGRQHFKKQNKKTYKNKTILCL